MCVSSFDKNMIYETFWCSYMILVAILNFSYKCPTKCDSFLGHSYFVGTKYIKLSKDV